MGIRDFFTKAMPKRPPDGAPLLPVVTARNIPRSVVSYQGIIDAEDAMAHPIVYRMLTTISRSVQHVKFRAMLDPEYSGKGNAGTARPTAAMVTMVNDLLKSPNDSLNTSQLLYWLTLNLASYGRVMFKVGTDITNNPNGIYPLETRWVRADIDERGVVQGYRYGYSEDDRSQLSPTRMNAKRENSTKGWVHEIYTPGLAGHRGNTGVVQNSTPLTAIGLPVQVTRALMQRAVDTAEGSPNIKYLIATEKNLTQSQQDALVDHVDAAAAGGQESANVLFLHNTKVDVKELSGDMSDIHSKIPMEDFTKLIAGAFGIPAPLLGLNSADAAKFAGNYAEARRSYWEDTLIPSYLAPIAEGLTAALCPPGVIVKPDLDSIVALSESRIARAKDLAFVPFLLDNEKRELSDYEELTPEEEKKLAEQKVAGNPKDTQSPTKPANTNARP
jgi:phage portal protein BeeE